MKSKLIILLFLLSTVLFSNGEYVGAGASYKYGTNARQIALSNSLISTYNRGYNALTNPALLGSVYKMEYGLSYFAMSLDRYIQTFSVTVPVPPTASIGLSLFMSGTDDIQGTDYNGQYTDTYKSWEGYGMLSFGLEFTKLSAGINIKILKNEIESYSANGIGVDIGLLYKLSSKNQFALLFDNLYTKYSWNIDFANYNHLYDEKFPRVLSLGFSSRVNQKLLSLYQVDYMTDVKRLNYKVGFELDLFKMKEIPLEIRLGLNNKNESFNYTFGFGYFLLIKNNLNLGIDYALDTGLLDEGLSHLFTLTFNKK